MSELKPIPVAKSMEYVNLRNKIIIISLAAILVTATFTFLFGMGTGYLMKGDKSNQASQQATKKWFDNQGASSKSATPPKSLGLYWSVVDLLKREYVDQSKLTEQEMLYGTIKGMVASLDDPATVFYTPEETASYNNSQGGLYEGVGMELGQRNKNTVVVTPFEGSPSKKAGLKPGDIIIKVDDVDVIGKQIFDIVKLIRGKSGSKVKIDIVRKEGDNNVEKQFKITRGRISSPSMQIKEITTDGIAYVQIHRFTESSYPEWLLKWNEIVDQLLAKNVKGIVLDLRNNPGGFLDAAVYLAEDFLEEGKVVVYQDAHLPEFKATHKVNRVGRLLNMPLIIMVNDGSASASEIFSGAIQYYGRAKLLGISTYGKGTAQIVREFKEDGSSLHLTVSKWLLPDKKWISHENTVKPDYEVELTGESFNVDSDNQYQEALKKLRNVLK